MQIFIEIGNTITLNVDSSDTVESLKSKIQEREGIPADLEICLVYGSKYLYDGKTLADYKIKNESTIHLVSLRLLSYKVSPTSCTTTPEKTSASIINETKTIDLMVVIKAKSHIHSWEGVGAAMSERFKLAGDLHLQPVSSTRALFYVENDKEREYLFKQEPWVFENNRFQFVRWSSLMNPLSAADMLKRQEVVATNSVKKSKRDLARKLGPQSKQIAKLKKALLV